MHLGVATHRSTSHLPGVWLKREMGMRSRGAVINSEAGKIAPRLGYGPCTMCDCGHWRSDGQAPERCGTNRDDGIPCGHSFNRHY